MRGNAITFAGRLSMTRIRLLKRALYVVPVLGAVVFGTAQAVAAPAPKEELACSRRCWTECGPSGGVCSSSGYCICY
jgi:hypothetical protein